MNTAVCSRDDSADLQSYECAFDRWHEGVERQLFENAAQPVDTRRMWTDWATWAQAGGLKLCDIGASDLEAYLQARDVGTPCDDERYGYTLLRLVDSVLLDHARFYDIQANRAARVVLLHRSGPGTYAEQQSSVVVVKFVADSKARTERAPYPRRRGGGS